MCSCEFWALQRCAHVVIPRNQMHSQLGSEFLSREDRNGPMRYDDEGRGTQSELPRLSCLDETTRGIGEQVSTAGGSAGTELFELESPAIERSALVEAD